MLTLRHAIVLLLCVAAARPCVADPGSAGFTLGLDCAPKGDEGSGILAASTGGGFAGSGTCDRTAGLFTRLTFDTYNAAMRATSVYALQTPSVLITPPFRAADVQPVFSVATACPVSSSTLDLNWIFVQWTESERRELEDTYLVGRATYARNGGLTITGQYDIDGSAYWLGPRAMPGSCNTATGVYSISANVEEDIKGDVFFNAAGMGVFKTSAQRATFFFPAYTISAAADFGSKTFRGVSFDSWSGNDVDDVRNVKGVADAGGTTFVVEPLSDPAGFVVDAGATYYRDTIALTANTPLNGMLTGTVTRSLAVSGNGTGNIACIAYKKDGELLMICSGESPGDNSVPYNISLYVEYRHNQQRSFDDEILTASLGAGAPESLYVGGRFTAYGARRLGGIARLTTTGLDTTFATGTGFNDRVMAVHYDSGSDKVFVAGWFTHFNGTGRNRLARLNSDGTLDTAFPSGGANLNDLPWTMTVDATASRIYVGGRFTTYGGVSRNRLLRLNFDGSLDTTFTVGAGANDIVETIVRDTANSLVYIGGRFSQYDGTSRSRLARILDDGSLDTTFVVPGSGFSDTVWALALDASNRIYAAGDFTNYDGTGVNRIVRLTATGAIDTNFAVGTGFNDTVFGLRFDAATGDLFVVGEFTTYNGSSAPGIVRLNTNGTVDGTLSSGTGFDGLVQKVTVASTGDVWAVGNFDSYDGTASGRVARLSSVGAVQGGTMPATAGVGGGGVGAIAIDPADRKVYVGGPKSVNGVAVGGMARLNSDGTLDTSFDTTPGYNHGINSIVFGAGGDLYVGGRFSSYGGAPTYYLNRLNGDGSADTVFATGTKANEEVHCLQYLSGSDQLLVAGSFDDYGGTSVNRLMRVNNDGTLDTTFGGGTRADASVRSVVRDPANGSLYIGGQFSNYDGTPRARLARLDANGVLDTTFSVGTGFNDAVDMLVLDSENSKLYVAGLFATYNGTTRPGLVRLNLDGSIDNTFDTGGGFSGAGYVYAIVFDPANRKIFASGYFDSVNGTPAGGVVRLNYDGSVDTGFSSGSGIRETSFALALDFASGDLYIGNSRFAYGGVSVGTLIKTTYSGALH